MEVEAKTFRVNVHLFDMSNIAPGFSYYYQPAPALYEKKCIFFKTATTFSILPTSQL